MNHLTDTVSSDLLPIAETPDLNLDSADSNTLKILMIHGHGSCGAKMFYKFRGLQPLIRSEVVKQLNCDTEYYFPNATEILQGLPGDYRVWGLGDYREDRVPRLEFSVRHIMRYIEQHGPFDGIIGSSAGGTVAVAIASLLEDQDRCKELAVKTTHPPVRFVITYSGFPMANKVYEGLYNPKIKTPVMAFVGEVDTYIPAELTLTLGDHCDNFEYISYFGGHFIPHLKGTTYAAADFICRSMKRGDEDDEEDWMTSSSSGE